MDEERVRMVLDLEEKYMEYIKLFTCYSNLSFYSKEVHDNTSFNLNNR